MSLRTPIALLAVLIIAILGASLGCSPSERAANGARARKVVSLSPEGTLLLRQMGIEKQIVAADGKSRILLEHEVALATETNWASFGADVLLVGASENRVLEGAAAETILPLTLIEIRPHDLTEALALYIEVGISLGDMQAGLDASHRLGDRFAALSVRQMGAIRPDVAVLVDNAPLTLAAGHSFSTDLVEIAGGRSLSHGEEGGPRETSKGELRSLSPDLVIVATPSAMHPADRVELESALAPMRVVFLPLDRNALWLSDRGPEIAAAWADAIALVRPLL